MKQGSQRRKYLITEYCDSVYYTGWHLYLRDSKQKDQSGGWIRRPKEWKAGIRILNELNLTIRGDGTCSDDGLAEFTKRFPIPRERICGRPRGCIEVDACGRLTLAQSQEKPK